LAAGMVRQNRTRKITPSMFLRFSLFIAVTIHRCHAVFRRLK
jgi:hypothetical protein